MPLGRTLTAAYRSVAPPAASQGADIVIFDPDTVRPLPESVVHDFPAGGWRVKEPAAGIMATIVNGEVLMENGKHTGALPGRVLRNTYYHANHA